VPRGCCGAHLAWQRPVPVDGVLFCRSFLDAVFFLLVKSAQHTRGAGAARTPPRSPLASAASRRSQPQPQLPPSNASASASARARAGAGAVVAEASAVAPTTSTPVVEAPHIGGQQQHASARERLAQYLESLRSRRDDEGQLLVSFPDSFDNVVGMMTRGDLRDAANKQEVPWAKYLIEKSIAEDGVGARPGSRQQPKDGGKEGEEEVSVFALVFLHPGAAQCSAVHTFPPSCFFPF